VTTPPNLAEQDELPPDLMLAFLPLHKRAFGIAVGLTFGTLVFLVTAFAVVKGGPPDFLPLLSFYFAGYTVSWPGAFIGFAWAGFAFFVAGWFTAFMRNLMIAVNLWIGYARANLDATSDFLDHI